MTTLGQELLCAIVSKGDLKTFSVLDRNQFFGSNVELNVFDFLSSYVNQHKQLPTISLVQSKFSIEDFPKDIPVEYLLDNVRTRYVLYQHDLSMSKSSQYLEHGDIDRSYTELENLKKTILDSKDVTSPTFQSLVGDLVESLPDRHKRAGMLGLATPWESLTHLLRGYKNADTYAFVARPKIGKSQLLIHNAFHLYRQGHRILFLSMELAKMEVTDRLVSMLTGESSNRVIRGELDSETRSLLRTINSEDSTFWIQEGLFRFNTLSLDRLVSKLDPEIVFIDGAYLMRPSGYSNRWAKWEIAGETAVQLKNIAMSRKVPIVCTYQFNRAAGKKDAGDVENIQLSDEIGQLISGMIGIYKLDNRRRKLSLKANRNGPVGEVEIWFDWERARFNEIVSSWRGNEERNQEVEGQG